MRKRGGWGAGMTNMLGLAGGERRIAGRRVSHDSGRTEGCTVRNIRQVDLLLLVGLRSHLVERCSRKAMLIGIGQTQVRPGGPRTGWVRAGLCERVIAE